ncbi:MAG: hypothetical protein OEZ20_06170 [candidate division WOR-3 bacterium]|nr:hypothetical protein [candidate division WOR-3 bacterium]MDH5684031.1 hypothetical protein [candidate division WOR-3 bacterium]
MNLLTREDLKLLLKRSKGLCVSIYISTYRTGKETRQNLIRFKNLIKEAENHLQAAGIHASEVQKMLEPGQKLLQDELFWSNQSDGLAVFISSDTFRHYRLPFGFEELVVVTDRFHIKPLLPLFSQEGRFYILVVSQNAIRLLLGTHYSVSEVALENLPKSLAEALKYDTFKKQLQSFTGGPSRTGKRGAIFYGAGIEDNKEHIHQYFQQIDKGLHDLLKEERAPLVFAGVEYLFPIYKEANTYPHLIDKEIPGNPDLLSAKELHDKVWTIVQPIFLKSQNDAAAQYKELAGTGQASDDIKLIIPAAYQGRVELLFVSLDIQQWGKFDSSQNKVHLHPKAEPDDEDLSDLAAIHTLLNQGAVYAVKPEKIPNNLPIAAIFRY